MAPISLKKGIIDKLASELVIHTLQVDVSYNKYIINCYYF